MPHEEIQWWNYNLPREQWTLECPEGLRDASEKDKGIIGSWEDEYRAMSWQEVKRLIGELGCSHSIYTLDMVLMKLNRY